MTLDVLRAAAVARAVQPIAQLGDELLHPFTVGLKNRIGRIDVGFEGLHDQSAVSVCRAPTFLPTTAIRLEAARRAAPDRVHAVHLDAATLAQRFDLGGGWCVEC